MDRAPKLHKCPRCRKEYLSTINQRRCISSHLRGGGSAPRGGSIPGELQLQSLCGLGADASSIWGKLMSAWLGQFPDAAADQRSRRRFVHNLPCLPLIACLAPCADSSQLAAFWDGLEEGEKCAVMDLRTEHNGEHLMRQVSAPRASPEPRQPGLCDGREGRCQRMRQGPSQ